MVFPPVREVWIEIAMYACLHLRQAVLPPVREVWIEIWVTMSPRSSRMGYLPYGRCGLKLGVCYKTAQEYRYLPYGRCGLKLLLAMTLLLAALVTSRTGGVD